MKHSPSLLSRNKPPHLAPLSHHAHHHHHHKRCSVSSLSPQPPSIPLITKTGPNNGDPSGSPGSQSGSRNNEQLIRITRQHSQPEPYNRGCYCCPHRSPQLSVPMGGSSSCCGQVQQSGSCGSMTLCPVSGGRISPIRRKMSMSSADDFATIAADSMKITGGLKLFRQVSF